MTERRRREALVLSGCLGAAALLGTLLRPARQGQPVLPSLDLEATVPSAFAGWRVDPLSRAFVRPAADQGRRFEIYEQVLERTFVDAQGQRVMLVLAAGNDRSTRMQLHLPEVCYQAGGFEVGALAPATLALGSRRVDATRLFATRPGRPEPITYWVVVGDHVVQGMDSFEARRNAFVRGHQAVDGMLVRVSSVDADPQRAWRLHERFARDLAAALAPAALPKLFGTGRA